MELSKQCKRQKSLSSKLGKNVGQIPDEESKWPVRVGEKHTEQRSPSQTETLIAQGSSPRMLADQGTERIHGATLSVLSQD